jgi:SAM-dependent methyltransferase
MGPAMARSTKDRVLLALAHPAARIVRSLPLGHRGERFLLERTWSIMPAEMLDTYLVSGYQNPRINVQSILLRHHFVRVLFGNRFDDLMEPELEWAVGLTRELQATAARLGVTMGSFIDPRKQEGVRRVDATIADRDREYETRWREALAAQSAERISILELACGSANDYRGFVDHGLARFIDYTGIDITARNIENARRRFPGVSFEVGDAVDLRFADRSFDWVLESDMMEHLAIADMERAVGQAKRIARCGLVLNRFRMAEAPDHLVNEKRTYYWNTLSRPRFEELLGPEYAVTSVTAIGPFLEERHGFTGYYAPMAYTFIAERPEEPAA